MHVLPSTRIRIGCGILAMLAAIARGAAAHAETHYELWPEADAWIRLTNQAQLLFIVDGTRNADGDKTAGEGGAYFDYRLNDSMAVRGGVDYQRNLADGPGEHDTIEHRVVGDFNYRWSVGEQGKLTDRSRVDFRDIEGAHSYRLRNRLQYDLTWHLGSLELDPYANVELFYDSRYHKTVTRSRMELGATAVFNPHIEATLYVGRQHDGQPQSKDTGGLGLTLVGRF